MHQSDIATNTTNISTNDTDIATNASNISTNTSNIATNTAKTGITSSQASAITANTAKTGITSSQASAITANTAKTVLALGTSSSTALAGNALSGTVNIGQTGATTTVLGTLNVDEAVALDNTLSVTGVSTFSGATALNGDVQIGNSASDEIGFFGATAVVQSTVNKLASPIYVRLPTGGSSYVAPLLHTDVYNMGEDIGLGINLSLIHI